MTNAFRSVPAGSGNGLHWPVPWRLTPKSCSLMNLCPRWIIGLRKALEKELKDLHARTGKTFVYITHSLEEAMVMSDRIAIMKDGRFEQIAVADEIYGKPVSRFVAEFMGEVNLFALTSDAKGVFSSDGLKISPSAKLEAVPPDSRGLLMVRPEYMRFAGGCQKL